MLARVLATRLQKVLPKVISSTQGAFVHGCQILDSVLIANDCIHSRNKARRPGLICKIDMEKAYDRVNWKFLLYLLGRMGFGIKWRTWILECLKSNSLPILINESPKGFFFATRGLRLGDLLSSFLFVIVGEARSKMMQLATNARLIKGFCPSSDVHEITHLQFADDTIPFCDAEEDQLCNIKATLLCYEVVSGL